MTKACYGRSPCRQIRQLRSVTSWPAWSTRWRSSPPNWRRQRRTPRSGCSRSSSSCTSSVMHQPLHASDNNDAGGNSVKVMVHGFEHKARDELHGFWDVQFAEALGRPPAALAQKLLEQLRALRRRQRSAAVQGHATAPRFRVRRAREEGCGAAVESGSIGRSIGILERQAVSAAEFESA